MLPTGSKGIPLLPVGNTHREQRFFWRATKLQPTFTPGWASHPGVKVGCSFVACQKNLCSRCVLPTSRLVTRTESKGFFLAGHETAAHLYSRVGFPPGSKGGLQFCFTPVLSNSLVKYNRNAIVFVKYIVN